MLCLSSPALWFPFFVVASLYLTLSWCNFSWLHAVTLAQEQDNQSVNADLEVEVVLVVVRHLLSRETVAAEWFNFLDCDDCGEYVPFLFVSFRS